MRERFISDSSINRTERTAEVRIVGNKFSECPIDYLSNDAIITFGLTWSPKWIGATACHEQVGGVAAEDAAQWVATRYQRNVQLFFPRLGRSITVRPA